MDTLASSDRFPNQNTSTITTLPGEDSEIVGLSKMNSKLPPELYAHIIDHIDDKPTLLSLLVSSKSVHGRAERKLYRSVKLENHPSHKLFLESILDPKRPHLARLVRRYSLCRALSFNKEFNILLTHALATLVNLKYLSFRDAYGKPSAQILPIGTPPPFQLHTFHWTRGRHTPLLGPFLDAQHSLEVLSLCSGPDFPSVSTTSLQNLRKLTGSTNVIAKVVPGRHNLTFVEWNTRQRPSPSSVNVSLIPSFSQVRILSFGIRGGRPPLGAVAVLLEHLEILELGALYATELVDLYTLVRLRTLVINDSKRGYGGSITPPEIFNTTKSLERIDLGYMAPPRQSLMYKRWVRGAQEPIDADASEVVWWSEKTNEMWLESSPLSES